MQTQSTDSTDYEERVLHYAMYMHSSSPFTAREAAIELNLHESRARSIILALMNLEVLKRQRIYPEHVFSYGPSAASMQLGKVVNLHANAAQIERQRKRQTSREVKYVNSR